MVEVTSFLLCRLIIIILFISSELSGLFPIIYTHHTGRLKQVT
jgi:hypothetical protein